LAAELGNQRRCCTFTAGFEHTDQLVNHFPDGQAAVGGWVPVGGQFGWLKQSNLAFALET
jgi:hypothetical protein